jgi:hypothetical protein
MMEVMTNERVKPNINEEWKMSMEAADRILQKIMSITAW